MSRTSRMIVGMTCAVLALPLAFAATRNVVISLTIGVLGLMTGILMITRAEKHRG